MRVAITGGTGFIGSHLARALDQRGYGVLTLGRSMQPVQPGVPHQRLDVGQPLPSGTLRGVDAVVHLAGLSDVSRSYLEPVRFAQINTTGTLHVLDAAREAGTRVVLASSQRVYRPSAAPVSEEAPLQPDSPYGFSKLLAERWADMYYRLYGLPTTVLRFFTVYGPGQVITSGTSGVVAIFVSRALAGQELVVHGRQVRDFAHVDDITAGIILTLSQPAAIGGTFNLSTGVGTPLVELAETIRKVVGSRSGIRLTEPDQPTEGHVADIGRARRELGYAPRVGLAEGIERYAAWYRAQGPALLEGPADTGAAS